MTEAPKAQSRRTILTPTFSERDHVQGSANAPMILVEYGDYHDPQCAAAQPWIKELQARMGGGLRLVFRIRRSRTVGAVGLLAEAGRRAPPNGTSLTAAARPYAEIGTRAVGLLLCRIKDCRAPPVSVALSARLIVRASSGA